MEKNLDRRNFLEKSLKAGISIAATGSLAYWLYNRDVSSKDVSLKMQVRDYSVKISEEFPEMVIVRGESPSKIVKTAIEELGGIKKFISTGDRVVIKPNIGWDRVPAQAANTNPEIVKAVVELCYSAGAKTVIVTDVSCNDPRRSFQRSGIANAALSAGAIVNLPSERKFRVLKIKGEVLDEWPVYRDFIEADKVINIPIAKHHNLSGLTMSLKNWYGILGGHRSVLHQKIDESIADLATFMKPTLTILDAYRILVANGPQGGDLADVRQINTVAAGIDQVAVDAFGATLFGKKPEDLSFIRLAASRGIGRMDLSKVRTREISI
ncbi:MAG: cytoplasmic protein [Candidatus Schekmanbacteria bacterium RIFCSPLOWO2_02_FULL_38_14]|nr:MAG: cytoplasmic protein [Candidatus Schekmanbacteria bacterium RIFCSPLOWO2_02_FULL_38_14]